MFSFVILTIILSAESRLEGFQQSGQLSNELIQRNEESFFNTPTNMLSAEQQSAQNLIPPQMDNRRNNTSSIKNTTGQIRYRIKLGDIKSGPPFKYTHITFMNRLKKIPSLNYNDINVEVYNKVATLTGNVRDEHTRTMIPYLIMLESGINKVNNQLVVIQ